MQQSTVTTTTSSTTVYISTDNNVSSSQHTTTTDYEFTSMTTTKQMVHKVHKKTSSTTSESFTIDPKYSKIRRERKVPITVPVLHIKTGQILNVETDLAYKLQDNNKFHITAFNLPEVRESARSPQFIRKFGHVAFDI